MKVLSVISMTQIEFDRLILELNTTKNLARQIASITDACEHDLCDDTCIRGMSDNILINIDAMMNDLGIENDRLRVEPSQLCGG